MKSPIRILLQTTIPAIEDNWHIGRFSLLHDHLVSLTREDGQPAFEVTARNRQENGDDDVLSRLDTSDFDELWLFAVDTGNGLSENDCKGITRFRQRGGGILATRDHEDLGMSLCTLGGVGRAHFFHSKQQEPDPSRQSRDDQNPDMSWPNYHSGQNGDYQQIRSAGEIHELLLNPNSSSGVIEYFPAHPHEGAVGVPDGEDHARVIATSVSKVSSRPFNLMVVFEKHQDRHGNILGPAVAQSSFHHLVDYNWDTSMGCPTFLTEPPGHQIEQEPAKLDDIKQYVSNVAFFLDPNPSR